MEKYYKIILFIIIVILYLIFTIFYYLKKRKWENKLFEEIKKIDLITQELNTSKKENYNIKNLSNLYQEELKNLSTKNQEYSNIIASLQSKLSSLQKYYDDLNQDNSKLKEINNKFNQEINNKNIEISKLESDLENEKNLTNEKIELLKNAKNELSVQFQDISNKILEEKSSKFTEQNKNNINSILEPIKIKMNDFSLLVKQTYDKENEARGYLKRELEDLKNLNYKLSDNANSLTKALTKQNKIQGDWGEMVLETILENSGLKKNTHYLFQQNLKDENNKSFRPDVIIKLPENKSIIIDSKVSLLNFKDYSNETDKDKAKDYLNKHIYSVENHIKDLSKKDYSRLLNNQILDFVFMFIPIEPAYLCVINERIDLINEYFNEKNIVIVGPSNLILTLKLVNNIWKNEYQNQNTQKIADAGGKLYDKFVNFTEDLLSIGTNLQKAQLSYEESIKKLKEGNGNLIKRTLELKELGIKNKKDFNQNLVNESIENDNIILLNK